MEDHVGGKKRDGESDGRLQPTLLLMSGKMTEMVSKHAHFFSHALPQKYNEILKKQFNIFWEITQIAFKLNEKVNGKLYTDTQLEQADGQLSLAQRLQTGGNTKETKFAYQQL